MRMRSLAVAVAAVAMLTGCMVLPPAAPTSAQGQPPGQPQPSQPSAAPTSPPSPSEQTQQSPTPTASPSPAQEPAVAADPAQCEASDVALAGLIEAMAPLDAAFPADGTPSDWATGDVVVADVQSRYDAWIAVTTDPLLVSAAPHLQSEIGELAAVVASRDETQVSFLGLSGPVLGVTLAAASVVLPCDLG